MLIGSLIADMKVKEVNSRKIDKKEADEILSSGYADFIRRTTAPAPAVVPAPAPAAPREDD